MYLEGRFILASSIHISFLEGSRKIIKKKQQLIPHHPFPDEDGFNILICLNSLKGPKAFPVSQTSTGVSSSPHLIYRVCNNRQNVSTYFLYFCRSTGRVPEKNYFHLFMSCIKARISSMSWRSVSRMIRSIWSIGLNPRLTIHFVCCQRTSCYAVS